MVAGLRAALLFTLLRFLLADYTTETWTSRSSDNIVGCFNAPGLGSLDWTNWAVTSTGDGDVAGKCESMCHLRTDGKTALVGLRGCDLNSPRFDGVYLTSSNGNYGCECYCGNSAAAYESDSSVCTANCPSDEGCTSTPSSWCQSSHTCVMTVQALPPSPPSPSPSSPPPALPPWPPGGAPPSPSPSSPSPPPPPPSPPPSPPSTSASSFLSLPLIAVVAGGGGVLLLLGIVALYCFCRRKPPSQSKVGPEEKSEKPEHSPVETLAREGAINPPGHWDVMISYTQQNGHAKALALKLYSSLHHEQKKSVWFDVQMEDKSEAAMKEAVEHSSTVIALVSGAEESKPGTAYLEREFCLKELRWAFAAGKNILPIVDAKDKDDIGKFIGMAPADLKEIGNIDFVDLNMSDAEYWDVGIKKVLKRCKQNVLKAKHGSHVNLHVKPSS